MFRKTRKMYQLFWELRKHNWISANCIQNTICYVMSGKKRDYYRNYIFNPSIKTVPVLFFSAQTAKSRYFQKLTVSLVGTHPRVFSNLKSFNSPRIRVNSSSWRWRAQLDDPRCLLCVYVIIGYILQRHATSTLVISINSCMWFSTRAGALYISIYFAQREFFTLHEGRILNIYFFLSFLFEFAFVENAAVVLLSEI